MPNRTPITHSNIGHARNALLGESLARLVEFSGFETIRATYPGDIGLGVITVVWAYQKFFQGLEPDGIHERGQWLLKIYVEANKLLEVKEDETPVQKALREGYETERRDTYRLWDAGDPAVRRLWEMTRQCSLDHLLILDIMMPDIKGFEVCKRIKSDDSSKTTKIIVLSAYLDEEKFKKMKENGADLCFSKPLPLPQLKHEVSRLLGLS